MADQILSLIVGQSGAGAIIGMIMGYIKKHWKPADKQMYLIPTILLSLGASIGVLWFVDAMDIWLVLLTTILIAGFNLIGENEAWKIAKKVFVAILSKKK